MSAPNPDLRVSVSGSGPAAMVVHGGGGPLTVEPIADHLAQRMHVLTPTLPGWNGTPRDAGLDDIAAYAAVLLARLAADDLRNVTVVGSSIGGWITAEMALADAEARVSRIVLIDAMGLEVPGDPVTDFYSLDPRQVVEHSFHDPDRFYVDPASLPAEQVATQKANVETMRQVAGDMTDPGLTERLAAVRVPALVVWGDSDRIVSPGHGRAYAEALADARFALVEDAGHLPQLEQPEATFALIDAFVGR